MPYGLFVPDIPLGTSGARMCFSSGALASISHQQTPEGLPRPRLASGGGVLVFGRWLVSGPNFKDWLSRRAN
jgi:hypothetical protein